MEAEKSGTIRNCRKSFDGLFFESRYYSHLFLCNPKEVWVSPLPVPTNLVSSKRSSSIYVSYRLRKRLKYNPQKQMLGQFFSSSSDIFSSLSYELYCEWTSYIITKKLKLKFNWETEIKHFGNGMWNILLNIWIADQVI